MLVYLIATLACVAGDTLSMWPLPNTVKVTPVVAADRLSLGAGFKFDLKNAKTDSVIGKAAARYTELLKVSSSATGSLKSCTLTATSTTVPEIIGANEEYSISVTADGQCNISADNTWGILRGLETFAQILVRNDNAVSLLYTPVDITDSNRFAHRGMMIDTARHYISLPEIKRVIDTLPMNKFNVLHWHVIDAESFPIDTPSEPTMIKGAFSPSMVYSMADLTEIQTYAYERGVEVILELDMPGHAAGWINGKKEIMADCFAKYYYNINDFALNPALNETYSTIQNILTDIQHAVGTNRRIHLGGDEVIYGCWKEDPSITSFMSTMGFGTDYNKLLNYFVQAVDGISTNLQLKVTHWEEVFKAGVVVDKTNTFFQVWTDATQINAIVSAGYQVIASPSDYWYLNIQSNTWQTMYSYDPTVGLSSSQAALIHGGEVCQWSEYIDDNNMETGLYPRAAAVGERLWSALTVVDTTDALNRLEIQHCRMANRGVRLGPVGPADYCAETYI